MRAAECPECGEMTEATYLNCNYCGAIIEDSPSLGFIRYPKDQEPADDARRIADMEQAREISMGDNGPGWVTHSDLEWDGPLSSDFL